MKKFGVGVALLSTLALAACSETSPARPDYADSNVVNSGAAVAAASVGAATAVAPPVYEPAYAEGSTVTINAIFVPNSDGPMQHAASDFYLVIYPTDHNLWPSTPHCNPCDHNGNGIDPGDFHDHVLDSMPTSGHGDFKPLWHVFAIAPAPGKEAAYAALLPMKSEEAIDGAIADGLATKQDLNFYFVCDVVSSNAAGH